MLLDSDLIRTFVAIAESGSFTRAAEIVHRTPSAVSMQVKRLEEMLGRSLFHREARAVRLTLEGEKLLAYGRRLMSLNEEAVAEFRAPRLQGLIRFGIPDDFGTFLPNILRRFALSHPQVDVDVAVASSRELMRRVAIAEVDLALLTIHPSDAAAQTAELVHTEPLIWVGVKGGRAYQQDRLPVALAAADCAWRGMALRALDAGSRPYRIAYSSEHGVGQLAAVMADLAVAPLPTSLIDGRFEQLKSEHGLPELGHYQIILQRGLRPDPIGDALADHVTASFGEIRQAIPTMAWHPGTA